MPKGFEPEAVEERWRVAWDEAEIGQADPDSGVAKFSMVIPPPNVTGALHLGHALDQTLQDVMARWKRMQGLDVLWLPGTDHAGIATQNVVEKALLSEGIERRSLSREEFEQRVWKWKERYGGRILDQMRGLGLSVDWSRLRFTLDPAMSTAVRRVFVELYEQGLIYRGEYMVNWCPRDQTAISDLEVKHEEVDGRLWKIRYPLTPDPETEGRDWLEVETTRPETMLGDTALAVHPDDARYADAVGRTAVLPLLEREIPVVADVAVDPEFGTGVVKVTPAHDPSDYEIGKRQDLELVQVIGFDGRMTESAGPYVGLDRFEARERVVEDLRERALLVGERPHRHAVGHSDRSGAIIEPQVSTQWFVKTAPLAEAALAAAEDGRVRFYPESQFKVYREWMTNIRDWCISRQLWWGHRIPAWHNDATGEIIVTLDDPDPSLGLRQDPDVLDTWFSSGLFPFSTLGWPEDAVDLRRYYPTDVLVTGYDILFFWVARMVMMGLHFRDEAPFKNVFLHGLIRDADGVKMSKSRGNGVDPQEVVDKYGADALRFMLVASATPGADFIFSEERVAGYRAFANKLWNATRFSLMNLGEAAEALQASADAADPRATSLPDRWILSRTVGVVEGFERNMSKFRFDEAAQGIYQFIWHEFCDWYVEMAKVALNGDDPYARRETRATLLATLEIVLRALHPIMPFLTEELWSRLPGDRGLLALTPFAAAQEEWRSEEAEAAVGTLQGIVTEVRRLRAEIGVEPRKRISLVLVAEAEDRRHELAAVEMLVCSLAGCKEVRIDAAAERVEQRVVGVVGDIQVVVPLEEVDLDRERLRLRKVLDRAMAELTGIEGRLANQGFLGKAPEEVVAKARLRQAELVAERQRLEERLAAIGG
ncbi:MAG TPA: valine--tRNA ligase [Acidobacteriota bacterium]|nr:valine--tRNA ligase [Acidobacteriota bacterium]